jgi:fibronectin type 3 domain-containing protein
MKRICIVLMSLTVVFLLATVSFADMRADCESNVNTIVSGIDGGKDAKSFNANDFKPYAFVMQDDGMLVVHPSLAGSSLKEKAPPVYDAVMKSTPDGTWVKYEWKGAEKNSYVKTTKSGLIVGSGY